MRPQPDIRRPAGTSRIAVDPVLRLSSLMMVRDAVRAGVGAARLPLSLVSHDLAAGTLVRWGDVEGPDIALWTLHPSRRLLSARVSAFLDYLKEAFPKERPTNWQPISGYEFEPSRGLCRLRPQRRRRHATPGLEVEFVSHQMPLTVRLGAVGHRGIGARLDLGDEIILDPEHDVGIQIFVAVHEDVRDQRLVSLRVDGKCTCAGRIG